MTADKFRQGELLLSATAIYDGSCIVRTAARNHLWETALPFEQKRRDGEYFHGTLSAVVVARRTYSDPRSDLGIRWATLRVRNETYTVPSSDTRGSGPAIVLSRAGL